jgi:hypothetical protein
MNIELLKVVDHPELLRNNNSKAILNTSNEQLENYKKKRERDRKLITLEKDVYDIKNGLYEIKQILNDLMILRGK